MAEKDGSTHLSAPAAAEPEASQQEQRKQSHQSMGQNKPYLAHSKNDREQEGGMDPPRPSDLYSVPRGMLDRSLQAQLGRQLRAIFSDVAQEPVPDRFIKLLEALEAREKRR
jgi:anti-sigma factor NepR-like protein